MTTAREARAAVEAHLTAHADAPRHEGDATTQCECWQHGNGAGWSGVAQYAHRRPHWRRVSVQGATSEVEAWRVMLAALEALGGKT